MKIVRHFRNSTPEPSSPTPSEPSSTPAPPPGMPILRCADHPTQEIFALCMDVCLWVRAVLVHHAKAVFQFSSLKSRVANIGTPKSERLRGVHTVYGCKQCISGTECVCTHAATTALANQCSRPTQYLGTARVLRHSRLILTVLASLGSAILRSLRVSACAELVPSRCCYSVLLFGNPSNQTKGQLTPQQQPDTHVTSSLPFRTTR